MSCNVSTFPSSNRQKHPLSHLQPYKVNFNYYHPTPVLESQHIFHTATQSQFVTASPKTTYAHTSTHSHTTLSFKSHNFPQQQSTMSPIVARAAIRATRAAAQGQARQFSVMRTMRNVARSFEPHPFQRLPIAGQPQAGDWAKLFKRTGGQVAM